MFETRICSNNEKTFFNSFKSDKNSKGGTHLTSYLLPGALSILLVLLRCGTDVMHSFVFLRLEYKLLVSRRQMKIYSKFSPEFACPLKVEKSIFQLKAF